MFGLLWDCKSRRADMGRFSVFATVSILPGGGFSLIGLELLARKFGVNNFTFVPSAFRKKEKT
ncbi:MAG: hypothetical protein PF487_06185 [Bacteroidales bacterium]|nr:hypothetical protein [Bacteroidales bacterium]